MASKHKTEAEAPTVSLEEYTSVGFWQHAAEYSTKRPRTQFHITCCPKAAELRLQEICDDCFSAINDEFAASGLSLEQFMLRPHGLSPSDIPASHVTRRVGASPVAM